MAECELCVCVCVYIQEWVYDEEHELILAGLLCLDMSEIRSSDPPRLMKCHGSGGSQQWSLGVSLLLLFLFHFPSASLTVNVPVLRFCNKNMCTRHFA